MIRKKANNRGILKVFPYHTQMFLSPSDTALFGSEVL